MNAAEAAIPSAVGAKQSQFFWISFLKAVAAQLIVLHHLAFYGPMSDQALPLMPALIRWLDSYGRLAVQVFLVIGGFLAAKSLSSDFLSPGQVSLANTLQAIWRRYLKLVPSFLLAILLAVGASAWAGVWMTHDSISAPPTWPQLAAHALLLHGVLDYESLSAGAWYVAIDFQLYASMALLLWLCSRSRMSTGFRLTWMMPVAVAIGVSASLFHFNRDAEWDVWSVYFFGSYGLGTLAWWASDPRRNRRETMCLQALILLPALTALSVDFRSRIALALAIACMLILFGRARLGHARKLAAPIHYLGHISYAVFLVHFPVCLIVNAAFTHFIEPEPWWQAAGMMVGWLASVGAGAAFHRWVQAPLGSFLTSSGAPVVNSARTTPDTRLRERQPGAPGSNRAGQVATNLKNVV